jgi:hypothetical protein
MKKRLSLLLAALFVASTMVAAPVFGGGKDDGNGDGKEKAQICHGTGSATNPFVLITVPTNSAHFTKHLPEGRDVLPEDGKCPDEKKDDNGDHDNGDNGEK